ncbi:MAG: hypothetical protein HYS17_05960 [Micavibrio aeruginosavorus]|uniref:Uncharacterized protein n=1 Tax=Micavibrio aeruginosavorus TaxID=349221 RepID=A0A7T5R4B6_9BACT|nr:MAG: hypothetical protein HYS17_05960 [Micavibrio aeruginosavorus]
MNLRIAENNFRFRITPQDLERLLRGQDVDQRVCLGAHCFTYRIAPERQGDRIKLEMAVGGFCLSVPQSRLMELRDMGRSKEGLTVMQGDVEISLQMDIKTQMRKAA